jgi:DNA polymerase III subunit beta
MRVVATAGALADALAIAAVKPDEALVKRVPALGAVHVIAVGDVIEIAGNVSDFAVTAKAKAEIVEPGEVAVNGAALVGLASGFPAEARITITGGDVTTITCGRSRYRLPQIPLDDLPAPLTLDAITGEVMLEGAALLRLLGALAVASKEEARHYLNGILLQTVGNDLVGVATDGRQLMKVTTPAGQFSAGHDLIVPLKAALTLRKLINKTSPDDVGLCRSKRLLAIRTADFVLVSKLVDGAFPDYERVLPKPATNTIEVERAELLAALGRLAAVVKAGDQKAAAIAALQWDKGGALELYLAGEVADDVVAGEGRGRGQTAMQIGLLIDLLEALDGARVVLDVSDRGIPMRVAAAGDKRVLALQMPCNFSFRSDQSAIPRAAE